MFIFIIYTGYNWKAPHKSKASDKMCTIYTLKGHALLREARRDNPQNSKANDIRLIYCNVNCLGQ